MNSSILTVAIPTFNRSEAVSETLKSLVTLPAWNELSPQILVIDNSSEDDTYSSLVNSHLGTDRVTILTNTENVGFQANFARLFFECKTDYVMVCSDEDRINEQGLRQVFEHLGTSSPAFLSPQFFIEDRLYRGRSQTRAIRPSEAKSATFYLSGLIWRVDIVRGLLEERYSDVVGANYLYPMYNLCALLLAKGERCDWLDVGVAEKAQQLPTAIEGTRPGLPYYSVESRWHQHIAVDDFLSALREDPSLEQEVVAGLQEAHRHSLARTMRNAISLTYPDLARGFESGAQDICQPRPVKALKKWIIAHAAQSRLLRAIWRRVSRMSR